MISNTSIHEASIYEELTALNALEAFDAVLKKHINLCEKSIETIEEEECNLLYRIVKAFYILDLNGSHLSCVLDKNIERFLNEIYKPLILPRFFGHQHLNFYTANSTSIGAL